MWQTWQTTPWSSSCTQMNGKRDVLTRPYSPPVRRTTSGAQDGGRDEVNEGQQPHSSRRECIPEDCRIRRNGFDRTRISQSARNDGFTPRRRWETKEVSAGGMLAPERHIVIFVFTYRNVIIRCTHVLYRECSFRAIYVICVLCLYLICYWILESELAIKSLISF